jgi:ketosteroid isomerase-like protein
MKILQELNAGYIRSVRESDVAWFERHLAADFVNGNADGTLADRDGFLKAIARPIPVSDFRCDGVRIRLLGDVAIIHARTLYTKADGTAGAGRYTDVWARRGGEWLCVSADVTRT